MATTPLLIPGGHPASQPGAPGGLQPQAPFEAHGATPLGAPRVYFGQAPVDCVTMAGAVLWLRDALSRPRGAPQLIMGPNAFLVNLAQTNPRFADALAHSALALPDGISVVWASRLLGTHIPERVPGGEFMEVMCAVAALDGRSVYLLGGLPGAAEGAARNLCDRYPGLIIAGTDCPPPGFDKDPAQHEQVLARIRAAEPDLLCVAFGAPKQEIWMLDHCPSLPIGAALSVGAAFDTQAGLRKRAPSWTHGIGAEWLYRLVMEPRRLWRRYLIGNTQFAILVGREWLRRRRERAVREMLQ